MDSTDVYSSNINDLKELKNVFSKFADITSRINRLHNSIIPPNVSNRNINAFCAREGDNGTGCSQLMEQASNVAHRNKLNESSIHLGAKDSVIGAPGDGSSVIARGNSYFELVHVNNLPNEPNICLNTKNFTTNGSGTAILESEVECSDSVHVRNTLDESIKDLGAKDSVIGVNGNRTVELDIGPCQNVYLEEFQGISRVMNIEVPNGPHFNEERLKRLLNKEPNNSLTNYLYYLFDDTNPVFDTMDRFLDSGAGNEIQTETGVKSSDEVTFANDMLDYNSHSCMANDIDSPELEGCSENGVIVDVLECSSDFCMSNDIGSLELSEKQVERYCSETRVVASDFATPTAADIRFDNSQISSNASVEPYRMKAKPGLGCDKSKMRVPTSNMGRYSKKNCCMFFLKAYSKLYRHLATVHKNEKEVKKFLALPIASKIRRVAIGKLRTRGRSMWNADQKLNDGVLSVCRRPKDIYERDAVQFEECEACGEYLRSTGVRRHWNNCTGNPLPGERIMKEFSRLAEARIHAEASQDLHTIFSRMGDDEEILVIRFDWIIIAYGNELCLTLWREYQLRVIKGKLRNAGKLLIASKRILPEISDFASLYHVSRIKTLVGAIQQIAGFNLVTKEFRSPGTASTFVTLVNKIGERLALEYMQRDDEEKEKAVNKFLIVFQREAKIKINRAVYITQINVRRDKVEILPSTEDVGRLAAYLDREREQGFTELSDEFSVDKWLHLAKLTLMSVLVFNRKRVGDTQNILLKEFEKREIISQHKHAIPDETHEMIKSRMMIRGKLYRTVPVLLKHHFDDCLELLIRHRQAAGVPTTNVYLFGLPSKSGKILTIDACTLFRTYSEACGAEDPSSLRGTKLRKHFASTCASLNLSDNDVTNVATFMGHSDKIHRDVYRHNALHKEVVQMSNLLEIARGVGSGDNIAANVAGALSNTNGQTHGKRKRAPVTAVKTPNKRAKLEKSKAVAKAITKPPQIRKKPENRSKDKKKCSKRTSTIQRS